MDLNHTQTFDNVVNQPPNIAKDILLSVTAALREKGYNPVNQIVGYLLSDDPTYITSFKNARAQLCRLERDELLEEIIAFYLANNDVDTLS